MRSKVDTTLFRKEYGTNFILVQIYVDDIIFSATNESLCEDFSKLMQIEFQISMMGELKFFLGLQIKQPYEGIYIHQFYIKFIDIDHEWANIFMKAIFEEHFRSIRNHLHLKCMSD
uniref:Reverse transcriptase Ty1/copia-type domain-containing protein n=1 Tax=Cajanus cajan TaxID=3821 RepID=A0A151QPG5_CAJCA|nr:hypothetical protein KK1_047165 [Cajanus cajan]